MMQLPNRLNIFPRRFEQRWQEELNARVKTGKKPSLSRAFVKAFGGPFFLAGLLKLLHDSLLFSGPVILKRSSFLSPSPHAHTLVIDECVQIDILPQGSHRAALRGHQARDSALCLQFRYVSVSSTVLLVTPPNSFPSYSPTDLSRLGGAIEWAWIFARRWSQPCTRRL